MRLAVLGVGAAFAGWEALRMLTRLTEKGIEFNQQLVQMKMAGYAQSDIEKLEAQAYQTMRAVPGSSLIDNIKNLIDLRNISGSAEHAAALSEAIAKTNLVLSTLPLITMRKINVLDQVKLLRAIGPAQSRNQPYVEIVCR